MKSKRPGGDGVQSGDEYGGNRSYSSAPLGTPVPRGTMGPGPRPGAGEMPPKGPGRAAMRVRPDGRASENRPMGKGTPGGLSTYKKGNPPPRGYHQ